ncbi:NADP-dependent oxidoreductase [Thaumasiovibrio sp. DFM-14]|uniref:NADP-dependent oxidoreductase n=1 Tax=Thaumasiovibrio sp. DFM-14 TaxID=3384792 RepID=UPI0039A27D1D
METHRQLQITAFGAPSVLQLNTQPAPSPSKGEVVVKVAFAGVNPVDAKTRAGLGWAADKCKDHLPWTPGFDVSGVIVAVGDGVSSLREGDRVAAVTLEGGCYAEYLTIDAELLSCVPSNVGLDSAAALPLAGQTAYQALVKAGVTEGQRVLILAGAGGVGHLAIQLATTMGAQVYATCSSANIAFVQAMGASALDYTQGPLELSDVDVLIDLVGGDAGVAALDCVKVGGHVITVPSVTAAKVCEVAVSKGLTAAGMLVTPDKQQCDYLLTMLADEQLSVHVSERYWLAKGEQAHQAIETGRTRGKLLLTVSDVN